MSNAKDTERLTHASRETLLTILETLPAALLLLDDSGTIVDANASAQALIGAPSEEVIGQPLAQTLWWSVSPANHEQLRAAMARARTGETVPFEALIQPREGTDLHLKATITRHVDVDHHRKYLIFTGIDITARKRADEAIPALIDVIPQFVWIMGPDGSAQYSNQRWCDYTGKTLEQIQGDGWLQFIHPEDRPRVQDAWQTAVRTGTPYEVEHRIRQGSTGDYRWFLARSLPHTDAQGAIIRWIGTCTDIDEQKQAEQLLKESRENWRVLAETIPHLMWSMLPDGCLDYANQRCGELAQTDVEHLLADGWRQFVHPDDLERTLALRQHALATGECYEREYRLRDGRTGAYRWFLARALPVRDDAGQILKWVGTCTDIDAQKQAEDDMRVLVDAIPQFVWMMRPDGSCDYCNQRWCDYTAMTPQQAQGDGWLQAIHPDDYQHTLALWQRAVHTGMPYEAEQRLREGMTGVYRWFLARAVPLKDRQGTILKWVGTSTDIDAQKRDEERVKASEQHWHVLAETVPQLVWMMRADGWSEYFNQRFCDYTHATPEHLQGYGWSQFLHPEDAERTLTAREHAFRTGTSYEVEYRFREGQTGRYRWFLARAMPVRDDAGQIVKWFGTSTDIDEQKRTEEALRQSQERANVLMNASMIGIFVDEGEQIVDANETFLRMTGYTREDLRAGHMNVLHMTAPEDLVRTQQAHQELATHQQITPYEKAYVCKDGSRLPVVVAGVVLQRHPFQGIAFVLDNSARKELEQRKDDFLSMVSHELKTPLTALKLQTALLQRQLAGQGIQASAPALSSMETQINKITRLVGELLDVSKIQAGRLEYVRETIDLDALLQEITDTMQQTSPSHSLVVHGATQTSLMGDPDRLGQVFINLLSNAIKYSPDAERVEIDLNTSDDAVTVSVRDHGLGIPREQRDKIFERFYRAAGPKQKAIPGLGMGLYIVAEIVKRHGGTITVDSTVGKGSTFTVTLPRTMDG